MSSSHVSRLTPVPLRTIWPHEEHDFSPWLAANLDVLSDQLESPLILDSAMVEQAAGDFRVDIVAMDEAGRRVIIENQLGRSDHDHLGKLITYLAAYEAPVAIWITGEAREEHIRAAAWLNDNTAASIYLFEVGAVRIDNSAPAPVLIKRVGSSSVTKAASKERATYEAGRAARLDLFDRLLTSAEAAGVTTHAGLKPSYGPYVVGRPVAGKGWARLVYMLGTTYTAVQFEIDLGKDRDDEATALMNWFISNWQSTVDDAFGSDINWDVKVDGRTRKARAVIDSGGWAQPERWDAETIPSTVDAMKRLESAFLPAIHAADLSAILVDSAE